LFPKTALFGTLIRYGEKLENLSSDTKTSVFKAFQPPATVNSPLRTQLERQPIRDSETIRCSWSALLRVNPRRKTAFGIKSWFFGNCGASLCQPHSDVVPL